MFDFGRSRRRELPILLLIELDRTWADFHVVGVDGLDITVWQIPIHFRNLVAVADMSFSCNISVSQLTIRVENVDVYWFVTSWGFFDTRLYIIGRSCHRRAARQHHDTDQNDHDDQQGLLHLRSLSRDFLHTDKIIVSDFAASTRVN